MAEIKPFRGITYNQKKVLNLSLVIAPPYDVISDKARERLYQNSNFNIVRVIKGKTEPADSPHSDNPYTRAAQFFQSWLKEHILERDTDPCFYIMEDEYTISGYGQKSVRQGFMALVKLETFDSGVILPHEKTLSKPKEDRLRLIQACKANLSPIFALYSDPLRKTNSIFQEIKAQISPFIDVLSQERIVHRVWRVSLPEIIRELTEEMKSKPVLIADGHHRYETALNYWQQMKDTLRVDDPRRVNYSYVMMYFANMDDPGLTVLPYHRLLKNLPQEIMNNWKTLVSPFFRVEGFPFDGLITEEHQARKRMFSQLAEKRKKSIPAYGLYTGDKHYYLLSLREGVNLQQEIPGDQPPLYKGLDVTVSDRLIINNTIGSDICTVKENCLGFSHDPLEAIGDVNNGTYQMALFLNPTHINQVYQIASLGHQMPQKSTFFYPKLPTGLIMRQIESD
ncbi:MAG: DUF1015 domain-containing protein [bacterium]